MKTVSTEAQMLELEPEAAPGDTCLSTSLSLSLSGLNSGNQLSSFLTTKLICFLTIFGQILEYLDLVTPSDPLLLLLMAHYETISLFKSQHRCKNKTSVLFGKVISFTISKLNDTGLRVKTTSVKSSTAIKLLPFLQHCKPYSQVYLNT